MRALVTIGRDSHNWVNIRIRDDNSRQKVCEVKLSLKDYAMLITGMSEIEGEVEYGNLDVIGKNKVVQQRSIELPYNDKEKIKAQIIMLHLGEDWTPDLYLNSQKSIVPLHKDNMYQINYSVHKYVDVKQEDN